MSLPPSRAWLLPYHRRIVHTLVTEDDEERDRLVVMAPGLGLRRVIATLLRVYAQPRQLVVLVNASVREVVQMNHDLGTLGLAHGAVRNVHYDMDARQRRVLYLGGGVVSVTTRILIVDMLTHNIPTEMVSGIVVLHAERVVPTSNDAFVIRLYRQANRDGFVKAFSERADVLATSQSMLQTVMGQLHLRNVDIWPRFHEQIQGDLGHRRADVIELHQPLSPAMAAVQGAIVACLDATLAEIRRGKVVEMDEPTPENLLHRALDVSVRRQLDAVWHRIGPGMKQLVNDLGTLRSLLQYLLAYDGVSFQAYLDTVVAANNASEPGKRSRPSQWLMSEAADALFRAARARVWRRAGDDEDVSAYSILPDGFVPVLEPPPKWRLLLDVLEEIEESTARDRDGREAGAIRTSAPLLIVTASEQTASQVRALLDATDADDAMRAVMEERLREYLALKNTLGQLDRTLQQTETPSDAPVSEALQRKAARGAPAHKRRRTRGGLAAAAGGRASPARASSAPETPLLAAGSAGEGPQVEHAGDRERAQRVQYPASSYFGLVSLDSVVVVHSARSASETGILESLRPEHVVLYDPDAAFVRELEVYRTLHSVRALRVYFLLYTDSFEEHVYLGELRREKDAFERLIRSKATMAIPLTVDGVPEEDADERMLRRLSTRVAGAQQPRATQPATVVVDMREFRSSLPSLLHKAGLQVLPCTLQVGDYVLSPEMCVERKSLQDLVQSFASGRLYAQCEAMSVHYQHAILLIEFDQERAFTLAGLEQRTGPKVHGTRAALGGMELQTKLAMLTMAFPRLRLIWSSSPYATADIFVDLKQTYDEPDAAQAVAVGLDTTGAAADAGGLTFHSVPVEMLRAMPGISAKNFQYIARRVGGVQSLCHLPLEAIQEMIGAAPARRLHAFLHTGSGGVGGTGVGG
ncbi:DNA repair protein RAD16 [Malassezia sp. CBS 17886]|nr:DNA repair protein RAD16 [Malassezia sp. CBS 17886]